MKLLIILAALLALPISGKAQTAKCVKDGQRNEGPTSVCVWEIDTIWQEPGVIMFGTDLKFYPDPTRPGYSYAVDTIPHWIQWPLYFFNADSIPSADEPWHYKSHIDSLLSRGASRGSGDLLNSSPGPSKPRVDTVRIVDTVWLPCDCGKERKVSHE